MVKVWDGWIRLFHWSLAAIIFLNHFYEVGVSDLHQYAGYGACALVLARFVLGFHGSYYARFSTMKEVWPKRGDLFSHFKAYLLGRTPRTLQSPPLAQVGMLTMVSLVLLLGLTGWMSQLDAFVGEHWMGELHSSLSDILIWLTAVHVVGVLRESYLQKENLIASMIHGKKRLG